MKKKGNKMVHVSREQTNMRLLKNKKTAHSCVHTSELKLMHLIIETATAFGIN